MEYEWRVSLRPADFHVGFMLRIYRKGNNGKYILLTSEGEKEIDPQEVNSTEYSLLLHPEILQEIFNQAQKQNFKPKDQSKAEGMLEAQSEHLKDLRQLLKLK